jgi:hypothetical protein
MKDRIIAKLNERITMYKKGMDHLDVKATVVLASLDSKVRELEEIIIIIKSMKEMEK